MHRSLRALCFAGLIGLLGCATASAQGYRQSLAQLTHKSWTVANGAPAQVRVAAQTDDGTLWLGGPTGLFRFDGVSFTRYTGPADQPFALNTVSALAAWPHEGLWIGYQYGGVSVLKDGHLKSYGQRDGIPRGDVKSILKDRDGSIWVAATGGLVHLKDGHWQKEVGVSPRQMSPYGALMDHDGTLWLLTSDQLLARASGQREFRAVADLSPVPEPRFRSIAMAADGRVWLADAGGLTRADSLLAAQAEVRTFPIQDSATLLFDHQGNLWLGGGSRSGGLRRLGAEVVTGNLSAPETAEQVESLAQQVPEALRGVAAPLLEDREGNMWVSSSGGLDRFSYSNIVPLTIPRQPGTGRILLGGAALTVDRAGTLWASIRGEPTGRLVEIRDGAIVAQFPGIARSTAAFSDVDGSVWFGGPTGLLQVRNQQMKITALPEGARDTDVQAIVRDAQGVLWVAMVRKGIFLLKDGLWSTPAESLGLPTRSPNVATADQQGNLWLGYSDSLVAVVHDSTVKLLSRNNGLNVGSINSISTRGSHVWVGGEQGLMRFEGDQFIPVVGASGIPFTSVSGITETESGELWLNGNTGVSHLSRDEIDHLVRDRTYHPHYEEYNYLDGILGTAPLVRPLPTTALSVDGRVWFSTSQGIVSVTPALIRRNLLPPPVTIWSIKSGNQRYEVGPRDIELPVHTTSLQIEYTAGSLSVPERMKFKYRLLGFDTTWQEVGARRQAFYVNLSPGRYTFQVIAANNDGVWNNTGASTQFTIIPAFYQTDWFYGLCALMCLLVLVILYRLRLQQVRAQTYRIMEARLQSQLAERERIARELHDTLLQSVQGLIWRFQAVANRIPEQEPARELMERSLETADEVLSESRDRVQDLRAPLSDTAELAQALAAEGERLALEHTAQFRASIEGVSRPLHPIVREEALLIAREALRNAFMHASAQRIEAELTFGTRVLHVRIRDDGHGITEDVLRIGGRPGHFGLLGMRERAVRIHAQLDIWSKPGAGTEIELRVPARMAYGRSRAQRSRLWRWLVRRADGAPVSYPVVLKE